MRTLFLTLLRMSLAGAAAAVFVLPIRLLLRRAPKKWSYLLWLPVLFRFVSPAGPRTAFSLFGLFSEKSAGGERLWTRFRPINEIFQPVTGPETVLPAETGLSYAGVQAQPAAFDWLGLLAGLWCAGVILLAAWALIQALALRRRLRGAVCRGGVCEAAGLRSPFVFGLFRPRICLPAGLDPETKAIILAHEREHIRRGDPLVRLIAFCALCMHWFNPLAWLAFSLMSRDMEMRCDEAVVSGDPRRKKQYGAALLAFAVAGEQEHAAPLSLPFCETGAKARIRNVLRCRRPSRRVRVLAALLIGSVWVVCASDPRVRAAELRTEPSPAEWTAAETWAEPDLSDSEAPVRFASPAVGQAVLRQLGRETGPVFPAELKKITSLALCGGRFGELSDLERLDQLRYLILDDAEIPDVSVLGRLSGLEHLIIENCELGDWSFLRGMQSLRSLRAAHSGIADLTPLAGLDRLTALDLDGNRISDLSPLLGLRNLRQVSVSWNPLAGGQAEALEAALRCPVSHSTADSPSVLLWPLDVDGDGKDEYAAFDPAGLHSGYSRAVLLDDDKSYLETLAGIDPASPVSLAVAEDPKLGPCILLQPAAQKQAAPEYMLLRVRDGQLFVAEEGGGAGTSAWQTGDVLERLRELYRSGSLLISTDTEGLLRRGLVCAQTGLRPEPAGAAGVIGLCPLSEQQEACLPQTDWLVTDGPIGVDFTRGAED